MLSLFLSTALAAREWEDLLALLDERANKRARTEDEDEEVSSSVDVPTQLGQAFDMTQYDVWEMSNIGTEKFVLEWGERSGADEFPEDCLVDTDGSDPGCSVSIDVTASEFSSSTEAVDSWSQTFSLGLTGGYGGYSGSLAMAFSSSGSGTYASVKSGALASTTAHNGCTKIKASCLSPGVDNSPIKLRQHFLDEIKHAGEHFLDTEGTNYWAMMHWQNNVIAQFGTDIAVQLDHGASIRESVTTEYNGLDYAYASSYDICGGIQASVIPGANVAAASSPATAAAAAAPATRRRVAPVPVKANLTICATGGRDNTVNLSDNEMERSCTTVGGGGSAYLRNKLCTIPKTATAEEVAEFLNTGFERHSGNVVGMKPLSLPNLWWQMNSRDLLSPRIFATYKKAIEYHQCLAQNRGQSNPVRSWDFTTGTCGCSRRCSNHGVVDPATCTCLCFGDRLHGYKGENCESAYGKCRPNANAGDQGQAAKCASMVDGKANFCMARHRGYGEQCDAGQTCCATYYSGTCCPYGYTCGHRRYWKRPINSKWADRNQLIYAGCSSGACDVCLPPQSEWNGSQFNTGFQLSTLFPTGTGVPGPLQSIDHPSWKQMDYGEITDMGRGVFDEDYRAGKENRGVSDDGAEAPNDELEVRLARLVRELKAQGDI